MSALFNFTNSISFMGGFWESLSSIITTLWVFIGDLLVTLIMVIFKWVLNIVDLLQLVVKKLVGLDYWGTDKVSADTLGESDIIFKFLFNENVQRAFRYMVVIFVVLLIVFTIIAIVKNEYSMATSTDSKASNSKKGILATALKSLLMVVLIPMMLFLGIMSSNAILTSLVNALNVNNDLSIGSQIFSVSAYTANRYRVYADTKTRYGASNRVNFTMTPQYTYLKNGDFVPVTKNYPEMSLTVETFLSYISPKYYDSDNLFYGFYYVLNGTSYLMEVDRNVVSPIVYDYTGVINHDGVDCDGIEGLAKEISNDENNVDISANTLRIELKQQAYIHYLSQILGANNIEVINGKNLNKLSSGHKYIKAAYNTWDFNKKYNEGAEMQSSYVLSKNYSFITEDGKIHHGVSFPTNSTEWGKYFDGGTGEVVEDADVVTYASYAYTPIRDEYYVMADVIDYMCSENIKLSFVNSCDPRINWYAYGVDSDITSFFRFHNGDRDSAYKDFIASYTMSGDVAYVPNPQASNEAEGSVYIMCYYSDAQGRFIPLLNDREFTDDKGKTHRFDSDYYDDSYGGVIIARGVLTGTNDNSYGWPSIISNSYKNSSGAIINSKNDVLYMSTSVNGALSLYFDKINDFSATLNESALNKIGEDYILKTYENVILGNTNYIKDLIQDGMNASLEKGNSLTFKEYVEFRIKQDVLAFMQAQMSGGAAVINDKSEDQIIAEYNEFISSNITSAVDDKIKELVNEYIINEIVNVEIFDVVNQKIAELVDSYVIETVDNLIVDDVNAYVKDVVLTEIKIQVNNHVAEKVDNYVIENAEVYIKTDVLSKIRQLVVSDMNGKVVSEIRAIVDAGILADKAQVKAIVDAGILADKEQIKAIVDAGILADTEAGESDIPTIEVDNTETTNIDENWESYLVAYEKYKGETNIVIPAISLDNAETTEIDEQWQSYLDAYNNYYKGVENIQIPVIDKDVDGTSADESLNSYVTAYNSKYKTGSYAYTGDSNENIINVYNDLFEPNFESSDKGYIEYYNATIVSSDTLKITTSTSDNDYTDFNDSYIAVYNNYSLGDDIVTTNETTRFESYLNLYNVKNSTSIENTVASKVAYYQSNSTLNGGVTLLTNTQYVSYYNSVISNTEDVNINEINSLSVFYNNISDVDLIISNNASEQWLSYVNVFNSYSEVDLLLVDAGAATDDVQELESYIAVYNSFDEVYYKINSGNELNDKITIYNEILKLENASYVRVDTSLEDEDKLVNYKNVYNSLFANQFVLDDEATEQIDEYTMSYLSIYNTHFAGDYVVLIDNGTNSQELILQSYKKAYNFYNSEISADLTEDFDSITSTTLESYTKVYDDLGLASVTQTNIIDTSSERAKIESMIALYNTLDTRVTNIVVDDEASYTIFINAKFTEEKLSGSYIPVIYATVGDPSSPESTSYQAAYLYYVNEYLASGISDLFGAGVQTFGVTDPAFVEVINRIANSLFAESYGEDGKIKLHIYNASGNTEDTFATNWELNDSPYKVINGKYYLHFVSNVVKMHEVIVGRVEKYYPYLHAYVDINELLNNNLSYALTYQLRDSDGNKGDEFDLAIISTLENPIAGASVKNALSSIWGETNIEGKAYLNNTDFAYISTSGIFIDDITTNDDLYPYIRELEVRENSTYTNNVSLRQVVSAEIKDATWSPYGLLSQLYNNVTGQDMLDSAYSDARFKFEQNISDMKIYTYAYSTDSGSEYAALVRFDKDNKLIDFETYDTFQVNFVGDNIPVEENLEDHELYLKGTTVKLKPTANGYTFKEIPSIYANMFELVNSETGVYGYNYGGQVFYSIFKNESGTVLEADNLICENTGDSTYDMYLVDLMNYSAFVSQNDSDKDKTIYVYSPELQVFFDSNGIYKFVEDSEGNQGIFKYNTTTGIFELDESRSETGFNKSFVLGDHKANFDYLNEVERALLANIIPKTYSGYVKLQSQMYITLDNIDIDDIIYIGEQKELNGVGSYRVYDIYQVKYSLYDSTNIKNGDSNYQMYAYSTFKLQRTDKDVKVNLSVSDFGNQSSDGKYSYTTMDLINNNTSFIYKSKEYGSNTKGNLADLSLKVNNFTNIVYFNYTMSHGSFLPTDINIGNLFTDHFRFHIDWVNYTKPEVTTALTLQDGEMSLNYNMPVNFFVTNTNQATFQGLYIPHKFNFIIFVFAAILIFNVMFTAVWGLITRIYEITMYFIVMPGVAAATQLDGGKMFKIWKENIIKKVLGTYGTILGLNLFFLLIPPIKSASQIFTEQDFAALEMYIDWIPGDFKAKFINLIIYLMFLLVALTMIKTLPSLISTIIGTNNEDIFRKGVETKKAVDSTIADVGATVSGKKAVDSFQKVFGKLEEGKDGKLHRKGGILQSFIPGSAIADAYRERKELKEKKNNEIKENVNKQYSEQEADKTKNAADAKFKPGTTAANSQTENQNAEQTGQAGAPGQTSPVSTPESAQPIQETTDTPVTIAASDEVTQEFADSMMESMDASQLGEYTTVPFVSEYMTTAAQMDEDVHSLLHTAAAGSDIGDLVHEALEGDEAYADINNELMARLVVTTATDADGNETTETFNIRDSLSYYSGEAHKYDRDALLSEIASDQEIMNGWAETTRQALTTHSEADLRRMGVQLHKGAGNGENSMMFADFADETVEDAVQREKNKKHNDALRALGVVDRATFDEVYGRHADNKQKIADMDAAQANYDSLNAIWEQRQKYLEGKFNGELDETVTAGTIVIDPESEPVVVIPTPDSPAPAAPSGSVKTAERAESVKFADKAEEAKTATKVETTTAQESSEAVSQSKYWAEASKEQADAAKAYADNAAGRYKEAPQEYVDAVTGKKSRKQKELDAANDELNKIDEQAANGKTQKADRGDKPEAYNGANEEAITVDENGKLVANLTKVIFDKNSKQLRAFLDQETGYADKNDIDYEAKFKKWAQQDPKRTKMSHAEAAEAYERERQAAHNKKLKELQEKAAIEIYNASQTDESKKIKFSSDGTVADTQENKDLLKVAKEQFKNTQEANKNVAEHNFVRKQKLDKIAELTEKVELQRVKPANTSKLLKKLGKAGLVGKAFILAGEAVKLPFKALNLIRKGLIRKVNPTAEANSAVKNRKTAENAQDQITKFKGMTQRQVAASIVGQERKKLTNEYNKLTKEAREKLMKVYNETQSEDGKIKGEKKFGELTASQQTEILRRMKMVKLGATSKAALARAKNNETRAANGGVTGALPWVKHIVVKPAKAIISKLRKNKTKPVAEATPTAEQPQQSQVKTKPVKKPSRRKIVKTMTSEAVNANAEAYNEQREEATMRGRRRAAETIGRTERVNENVTRTTVQGLQKNYKTSLQQLLANNPGLLKAAGVTVPAGDLSKMPMPAVKKFAGEMQEKLLAQLKPLQEKINKGIATDAERQLAGQLKAGIDSINRMNTQKTKKAAKKGVTPETTDSDLTKPKTSRKEKREKIVADMTLTSQERARIRSEADKYMKEAMEKAKKMMGDEAAKYTSQMNNPENTYRQLRRMERKFLEEIKKINDVNNTRSQYLQAQIEELRRVNKNMKRSIAKIRKGVDPVAAMGSSTSDTDTTSSSGGHFKTNTEIEHNAGGTVAPPPGGAGV